MKLNWTRIVENVIIGSLIVLIPTGAIVLVEGIMIGESVIKKLNLDDLEGEYQEKAQRLESKNYIQDGDIAQNKFNFQTLLKEIKVLYDQMDTVRTQVNQEDIISEMIENK